MTITPKQRKGFWLGAILLLVIYYAPDIVMTVQQAAYQRQATQTPRGPTPSRRAVPAPAATTAASPPADAAAIAAAARLRDLLGAYSGGATLANRGLCSLKLELRDNRETPGQFSGYTSLACTPLDLLQGKQSKHNLNMATIMGLNATSAILTGTADGGTIRFHVDNTINAADGCSPTAFTIKPFGTANRIIAEWQDSCRGGVMVLTKSGR